MLKILGTYKFQMVIFLDTFLSKIKVVKFLARNVYAKYLFLLVCCHNNLWQLMSRAESCIKMPPPPLTQFRAF